MAIAILSVCAASSAVAQATRGMTLDDVFDLYEIQQTSASPIFDELAVVVARPWRTLQRQRSYAMFARDYADVWLVPASGARARNITNGAADQSGWFAPVWSPDGRRLAMLSTRGGDNVRLYIWDRTSSRLTRVMQRGIDMRAIVAHSGDRSEEPIAWLDDSRLIVVALAAGATPPDFGRQRDTPHAATAAWRTAAAGLQPTASVLESGLGPIPPPPEQLLVVDVAGQTSRVLAEGAIRRAVVAPSRAHVAIVAEEPEPPPDAGKRLTFPSPPLKLGIAAIRSGGAMRWLSDTTNPQVRFGAGAFAWSPDGTRLAAIGSEAGEGRTSIYVGAVESGAPSRVGSGEQHWENITWSPPRRLMALGGMSAAGSQRPDWWALTDGTWRNVTAHLPSVPDELHSSAGNARFHGVGGGDLLEISPDSSASRNLTETFEPVILAVSWSGDVDTSVQSARYIVRTRTGTSRGFHRIDVRGEVMESHPIAPPTARAVFAGHLPKSGITAFASAEGNGSFYWTTRVGAARPAIRLAFNQQLANIAEGKRQLIRYADGNGDSSNAILVLPVGYQAGKRYPTVTWVYSGVVHRDTIENNWLLKNHAHADNLQILTGAGYAVLLPSIPSGPEPRDPYLDVRRAVLPAVARAVESGVVDSNRVAVMGQSQGGYDTYALVTQSDRFRAGIAMYGFANLASNYGTFDASERYSDGAQQLMTQALFSETSVFGLGRPPWADVDRYTRNSPVSFLDRVNTPLLIIHGDFDYVPIQQSEEVFTGLRRLGKRARFVRYWGEGHGMNSPANARDRWRQIFDWLDTHLR